MNEVKISKLKKIQKIVQNSGFIFIMLVFLWLVLPVVLGVKSFVITNNSMSPAIQTGDIVYVKHLEFEEIKVDDILTFSSPVSDSITFTHRVEQIVVGEQLLITKGDANETIDPSPAMYENVVGKVEFTLPWAGNIVLFIRSFLGIAIVSFLFIGYFAFDVFIAYLVDKDSKLKSKSD
jgi:signal peptidase